MNDPRAEDALRAFVDRILDESQGADAEPVVPNPEADAVLDAYALTPERAAQLG